MSKRLKVGLLTRHGYQLLSDAKKKPYEDFVAKHGYTMFDLHQIEVTKTTVKLWTMCVDSKGHRTGHHEVKEFPR